MIDPDVRCLDFVDFLGSDKYVCRIHDADIYIDPDFWDDPDDSWPDPMCEALEAFLSEATE